MDRLLKNEIVRVVEKATTDANEKYLERWVTGKELSKHIGVFTESWLKHNGCMLPRTYAMWVDDAGEHRSSFMYPLHKILRMVETGEIKQLRRDN